MKRDRGGKGLGWEKSQGRGDETVHQNIKTVLISSHLLSSFFGPVRADQLSMLDAVPVPGTVQ